MVHGRLWFKLGLAVPIAPLVLAAAVLLTSSARSAEGATLVVNEVQYDPEPGGSEAAYEWLELLNTGVATVSLAGWAVADNRSSEPLPAVDLAPGEFLVVAATDAFRELYPDFGGRLAVVGGSIGNGLGNDGDRVLLLDPSGAFVDGVSYGDDASALDPPAPRVPPGHSLERVPAGLDTDSAGDWIDQSRPSPGMSGATAGPTEVPATPAPPAAPGTEPVLNEYLPAPRDVDWDGDGQATADDEWIELFNPAEVELILSGWRLDDLAEGGSEPYVIADDLRIAAGGHLVFYKKDTGVVLNNDGDEVRLLRPDGSVADAASYRGPKPDASYARDGDGTGAWTDALTPSPGRTNGGGPPPAPSPGPTPPPGAYLPYLISEVMFDPAAAGNDAGDEWVEIHNRTDREERLAGWSIGDRAGWDPLPDVPVPPRGHAIIVARIQISATLQPGGAPVVAVADGAIGNGLANRGDVVRLRAPTGAVADAVGYGDNLDAFDPSVPLVPAGWSIERIPPDVDSDSAADWWPQPAPSPGRAGERLRGPPPVRLNEILPSPSRVDWNGDGAADHTDEWIELYNGGAAAWDLGGWRLEHDGAGGGWWHDLAPGTEIAPNGFLVLHRSVTGLRLVNDADTVRLVRDDGMVADAFNWDRSPGYDRSWSRTRDGDGDWTRDYAVTPGGPNRPRSDGSSADGAAAREAEPPPVLSVSAARNAHRGTPARLIGRVTASTAAFGPRETYIADETGGMKLYLADAEGALPAAAEGARAIATGALKDYHGERELVLAAATDLWIDDSAPIEPVAPREMATADVLEAAEGLLVRVAGIVSETRGSALWLDDGSGAARVVVRPATGIGRLAVRRGDAITVTGIVGQYAQAAPYLDGHRLTPRARTDLRLPGGGPPQSLPRTGRGGSPE